MGKIERFEDLIAWRKARELTRAVYEATRQGVFAKDYGLSGQIQRAAVSIMSNIAEGFWSLWQIAIAAMEWNRRRIMPLFLADNGMVYMQTARHVWDQLLAPSIHVRSVMEPSVSQAAFEKLQSAAEEHGKFIYETLVQEHRGRIAREREKAEYAFAVRRKNIGRIGLPQVRNYRLNLLLQEERSFHEQLNQKAHAYPEMVPLLVIRVEGGGHE